MLRAIAVWFLIMIAESIHGTLRRFVLEPAIGDLSARRLSVFTGMLIIFVITFWTIRWVRERAVFRLLLVGLLWVILTVIFELALGKLVSDYTWDRILEDFDPSRGGLMGFGLLFMLFTPLMAARVRGLTTFQR